MNFLTITYEAVSANGSVSGLHDNLFFLDMVIFFKGLPKKQNILRKFVKLYWFTPLCLQIT